jgi:hypothetical protein
MPRAAIDLAGADAVLTLAEIADGLLHAGCAQPTQRTTVG